jgi:hypothetical protein
MSSGISTKRSVARRADPAPPVIRPIPVTRIGRPPDHGRRDRRHNAFVVRAAYLALYAGFAALGGALLARPAVLWAEGLGLFGPTQPWPVPFGGAAVLLAAVLAGFTVAMAVRAAAGARPRRRTHFAFLLLIALALALRAASGELVQPADPAPRLIEGLRTAAGVLDAEYASTRRYAPTAARLQGALAALPGSGFVRRGRELRLTARLLHGMPGPQLEALPGDRPGTVYVCISSDEQRAWLSALSLHRVLPVTVQATAGTHSAPGFDPLLPLYPRAGPPRP